VLALDIDGVITDGSVSIAENDNNVQPKRISMRDLDALSKLRRAGLSLALVTGESGPLVEAIARRVSADAVISGAKDKIHGLEELARTLGVEMSAICFVGDAERDALAFSHVGLSLAPSDAGPHARRAATKVLRERGGNGAVSEAVELILGLQKHSSAQALRHAQESLEESLVAHQEMVNAGAETIVAMAEVISDALRSGGKVMFCGNGGSAADAQHAAAELMGRFLIERGPLPALSLSTDTSVLTAVGNDWDFDDVFARQVRGLARVGDIVVGLSTSGRSENIVRALNIAKECGARALSLTGHDSRRVGSASEMCLNVPSSKTPRIQELHILALHTICDLVERELFSAEALAQV
jgi:D-sedoheptulose 7-phosphate isomerase